MDMDDDDGSWIPLSPTTTAESFTEDPSPQPPSSNTGGRSQPNQEIPFAGAPSRSAPTGTSSSRSNRTSTSTTTQNLQRRLETRINLKSNLVDHPIDLFWKRYLLNLAREVWALELHIRLGLCMVVLGIATKLVVLSTWYFWYPRLVLVTTLLVAATLYLDVFGFQRQFDILGKMLSSPDALLQIIQQLDATGIRRLTVVLLLIPTMLEMRTLSFLSGIKAETGWSLYNALLSCLLLGLMLYWFRVKHIKPRECLYRGLLVLYGSALWVTIYMTNLSRLPILAAPFLTATGTILITYQDDDMEWVSRVLRHALRLALRDVLSSMGEKVSEDEMLQLAMLRWIADYWASAPTTTPSSPAEPSYYSTTSDRPPSHQSVPPAGSNANTTTEPAGTAGTTGGSAAGSSSASRQSSESTAPSASSARPQRASPSEILQRRHDVSWEELLPMLNVATEHMTSEVLMLQTSNPPNNTGATPNFGMPQHQTTMPTTPSTGPIDSFQDMLHALNVDERATPAVRAYKRAVESFPPSQEMAVIVSVLRRCPAFLTILLHIFMLKPGVLSSTMVLLPFVVLEYYRIMAWMNCCEQVKVFFGTVEESESSTGDSRSRQLIPSALRDANPMLILLVGDSYNPLRPPALLLVWQNIVNSVSALEVGLTAARCAETTAVAVKFAGNVLSLVQFGQELHEHGLLHGLLVMGKEAILLHTLDETIRNRESTKYTNAAMGAMENAQRVARNVQTLADDDNIGHIIQPIVWAVSSLSGYGWLWGQEPPANESSSETTNETPPSTTQEPSHEEKSPEAETPTDGEESPGAEIPTDGEKNETPTAAEAKPKSAPKEVHQLSDLMEEIVEFYGDGDINEAQKDDLCERLSHVSSTDSSAVTDIKKALAEFVEQNKIDDKPPPAEEKERVRSSAVIEMVLAAYYRGLIDVTEKGAFCQRIAGLSDEERTDPDVVGGMIRTLTAILENGEPIEVKEKTNDQVEPSSRMEIEPASSSREAAVSETTSIENQDEGEQSHVEQTHTPGSASAATSEAGTRTSGGGNPHDGLVRLGMATLSFIVGGVLLAQNGDENNQDQQNRDQQNEDSTDRNETTGNSRSTVVIEELEDEVDEEWITVPQ